MKNASVKWGLLLALVSLAACGQGDEIAAGEEGPAPVTTSVEESAPAPTAPTYCVYYTCPRTGRSYGGRTDYEANHKCELYCGDFCTYDGNVCA